MSLAAACGWACLRSLLLALFALPIMSLLCESLKSTHGMSGRLAWTILLAPFFSPELLVGYAYASFSVSLLRHPYWNEAWYAALVAARFIPLGTLALYFAPPPPLSAEARYCRRLALPLDAGFLRRCGIWIEETIQGSARSAFAAGAIVFLLAFQEFEMASLMGTTAWTKWLFDVQAGGLSLAESWRLSMVPLAWETAILAPLLILLLSSRYLPAAPPPAQRVSSGRVKWTAWCYLLLALAAVCVIPTFLVIQSAGNGFSLLWHDLTLRHEFLKEILRSGVTALVSGTIAFAVTAWFLNSFRVLLFSGPRVSGRVRTVAAIVISIPGLVGSLIFSLSLMNLFQHPALRPLYDTPLVLIAAQVLVLIPRAFLLQLLLQALRPAEGLHLATLLGHSPDPVQQNTSRELQWNLRFKGWFWGIVLLCYWAYLDLTASSLLAPTGMVSAPVRLYNLMHYGQSALLSSMLLMTIAAPVILVSIILAVRRPVWRWLYR